jgi:ParB/RepB/Spo0J family partition protein
MQDEARNIPLTDLVEPRIVLRLVDRDSVEYLELRDSLADKGFLNSICVRPYTPLGADKYEIVDGLYRYNCAKDLQRSTVPCIIKHGLTDDDVIALQIQANAVRPETTPTEYARQLKKIMSHRPGITEPELANLIHKNPRWVKDMLGLLRLQLPLQRAVDRGEIVLGNAYYLAKIPRAYRKEFEEQAKLLPVKEFTALAAAFIKRYSEAVRQGKLEALYTADFTPVAYLRGLKEVQAEYERREQAALHLTAAKCESPLEAWYLAMQWMMHLDPASVEQQRQAAMNREHQSLVQPSMQPSMQPEVDDEMTPES